MQRIYLSIYLSIYRSIYIYVCVCLCTIYSKEVSKSNFRQYGQMKSRAGKRQREEKDQKKEE